MKLIICRSLLFLAVVASATHAKFVTSAHNDLEKQLLRVLELWRNGDIHNIMENVKLPFTLPLLELMTMPAVQGTHTQMGIKFTYFTSELELTGLKYFSVKRLMASEANLTTSIQVTIPKITIYAEKYNISGCAYFVYPLKGSGNMWITLKNATLVTTVSLVPKGSGTEVNDLQFSFAVERVMANLVDSSWPINNVLSKDGAAMIAGHHDEIVAAVVDAVLAYSSEYLATVTPTDIINSIQLIDSEYDYNKY